MEKTLDIDKELPKKNIFDFLRPENDLEKNLLIEDRFVEGLFWGEPRYGHPEGQVIFHVKEVFDNIDKIPNLSNDDRQILRIVAIVHDTFKYKEQKLRKIYGRKNDNHHAHLATVYLSKYTKNKTLLKIVSLHDEAYYCWRILKLKQELFYKEKLQNLLNSLGNDLQLYYLFFKCDTQTGDKNQEPLSWFEEKIQGIQILQF